MKKILQSPLLNINALERAIGCPKSTIAQYLAGKRELPSKWIAPIIRELSRTGLVIDGWLFSYHENDHSFAAEKIVREIESNEDGEIIVAIRREWFFDLQDILEWLETPFKSE